MFRSSYIVLSLAALTACTQSPVEVAMRGTEDFSIHGRGHSGWARSDAPVVSHPSISYIEPAPVTYSNVSSPPAMEAPQTMASSNAISVSDLQPAAGKAEDKAPQKAISESVPANGWTGKPRDASAFSGDGAHAMTDKSYIWPVNSKKIVSAFGSKDKGKASDGISIAAQEGEPVWAVADGEIVYADSKLKGYGKMVIVKHKGDRTSTYAHLARYAVEKYDRVQQGDIIGYVGATGNVKKSQLYFSMREGTKAVDPQKYLDHKMAGL